MMITPDGTRRLIGGPGTTVEIDESLFGKVIIKSSISTVFLWTILFFISRENIMSVAWGNRPGFSVVSVGKQVSSKVWSLKTIFISDRISSFYIVNYWLKVRNTIRHAHFLKIVPRYIKIIDQIFGNFHSEIVELQIYILKYHQLCHIINCTCWTC